MRRLAFVALLATSCFSPDEPPCSFACGSMGECPDDYMCLADGYCHKNGDNSACGFSDAAMPLDMAEPLDLSVQDAPAPADGSEDLTTPPDLTQGPDGSAPDLAGPLDMTPPLDLAKPLDMTPPPDLGPSCSNLIKDGTETDTDCGGACPAKCADGKMCNVGGDCTSTHCSGGKCIPTSCFDTTQNNSETDVDCGGGVCPPCAVTKMCSVNGDCTTNNCVGGVCQAFMALAPCASPTDYTFVNLAATTVTFPGSNFQYTPKCLTVKAGTTVTFTPDVGNDFATHPLTPSTRGTMPNPIPSTTSGITPVPVTFSNAGFYPYYCANHGADNGTGGSFMMNAEVQVIP